MASSNAATGASITMLTETGADIELVFDMVVTVVDNREVLEDVTMAT
jgi:hypothetical protein